MQIKAIKELPSICNFENLELMVDDDILSQIEIETSPKCNICRLSIFINHNAVHLRTQLKSVEHYYRIRDKFESLLTEFS